MNKIILILFFWMVSLSSSIAQLKIHSFEQAEKLTQENPKPIVVFIQTSWCKFCKMMENSTFKNKAVINELNTQYYFVSLDAETKKEIQFNQHTFQFKPTGTTTGIHELATALATIGGVVSYPTLTILDIQHQIIFQKSSYLNPKTVLSVLQQFKTNKN